MHYVKSLETGSWWDSAKRRAHEVSPGTVVEFEDARDAAYFGDGERGEPVSPKAESSGQVDDGPKPKRGSKKKDSDDVQKAAGE